MNVLPDQIALGRVLERGQQEGISMEETEEGILVRDSASMGVVLATSNEGKGA